MNDESGSLPAAQTGPSTPPQAPGAVRFSWPPPGLEGIQGTIWSSTGTIAIGSLILVLPLLWSVGRVVPFYSLGPFGDTWWVLILTSLVGLLLLLAGLGSLFKVFWIGRKAGGLGVSSRTVLLAAADGEGDMGFLLQGARVYQKLDQGGRERLARARVWAAVLYLAAALWVATGFFLSVFLAARGVLGPQGVWLLTLGPVGVFLLGGLTARAYQGTVRRKASLGLSRDPWKGEELRTSVSEWVSRRNEPESEGRGEAEGRQGRLLSLGSVLVVLLAALIALPAFTLTLTSTVGPILASIAVPNFNRTQEKAAKVEVYRRYRLEADPSVTPLQAGEALANLGGVGGWDDLALMKAPSRTYEEAFSWDDGENPLGIHPWEWGKELFPKVVAGLNAEERAFLEQVAAHPALDEFGILARASGADFLAARYELPFPEGTTAIELPLPRFSKARSGAHGMLARAAAEYLGGDPDGAEETLREVISAGFLLGDEGPTLIDNLIGYVLVISGGEALEGFLRASGRDAEAETILWGRSVSEQAVNLTNALNGNWGAEGYLRQIPATVTSSEETIRGLRWEFFTLANALAPCINAHKVVFGPDEDMAGFIRDAREVLVRYPSEAALFNLVQGGWFVNPDAEAGVNWLGRIVDLTLGGSGAPGSCASMLSSIQW